MHRLLLLSLAAALRLAACALGNTPMPPTAAPAPTAAPPPATLTPEAGIQVWLTLPDQSKKLSREPALEFAAGPGPAGALTVDAGRRYQIFEGAGAAMTDSSAWLIMTKLGADQRARLLQTLFTRAGDGIGLSYLRVPLGASDFALSDYTYDDVPGGGADPELKYFSIAHDEAYILPALRLALGLNPALRLMGSPWSAPARMKAGDDLHGGALKEKYYQAFANYHVKFVQAYAAAGVPIDTLSPQNEPMYESAGYPTMGMSAVQQQAFVRDYLGPALERAGLATRLLILDHNWDLTEYALTILRDPAADLSVAFQGRHFAYTLPAGVTVTFKWPGTGQ